MLDIVYRGRRPRPKNASIDGAQGAIKLYIRKIDNYSQEMVYVFSDALTKLLNNLYISCLMQFSSGDCLTCLRSAKADVKPMSSLPLSRSAGDSDINQPAAVPQQVR